MKHGALTLFGRNTYYASSSKYNIDGCGYARIANMQIFKNGQLLHNFQPKSLTFIPPTFTYKPIGFFDAVTNKFLLPKAYIPFDS